MDIIKSTIMNNSSVCDLINFGKNIKTRNKLNSSLDEYNNITKEHINKYLDNKILQKSQIKKSYIKYAINNEDIFADLVTSVMMADWTHDSNRSSQRYWRTKCLLYTITNIIRCNKYKNEELSTFVSYKTPVLEILHQEQFEISTAAISKLNTRQRKIVKFKYYRNFTDLQIARRLKISQPRVSQILNDIKYELAPTLESIS